MLMAYKKKPVKKPVKTNLVPQWDLSKPFDLTDVSQETLEGYVFYLKEMLNSGGWKFMSQVLDGNKSLLEQQIVTKQNFETKTSLTDEEVDDLRMQHAQIVQLSEMPKKLIEQYQKPEEAQGEIEYDPYSNTGVKDKDVISAGVMSDTT